MEVEMKMVKSLLLGTAAGFVAVAGAQAADMPVKAAPVQYVKICTLYGDGFYYIPGTDTCIKLGGILRVQVETKAGGGGLVDGNGSQIDQALYDRQNTNDYDFRVRSYLSWDVRQQTQYGTLRTYIRIGISQSTPADPQGGVPFWDRAFTQFAGFTVGKAQSFFDTVTYGGAFSYHTPRTVSDTGATGWNVWAYTAQFGNGWSGTLSLEDPNRTKVTVDNTVPGFFSVFGTTAIDNAFATQTTANNGFRTPDVVAQLRWDQAWGFAAVAAAMHDASGGYWDNPNNVNNGHPPDVFGWAVSGGAQFNIPGGHALGFNAQWAEGANGYGIATGNNGWSLLRPGTSVGVGWATDGVFATGTDVELTQTWNVIAFYQHIWSPQWRTSIFGGFGQVDYSDRAKEIINQAMPTSAVVPGGAVVTNPCNPVGGVFSPAVPTFTTLIPLPGNSCDPNFSFFEVGTRTQWNPVPQLDIGLQFMYTRLNTAYAGPAFVVLQVPQQSTVLEVEDQDVFSVLFRFQRNFFP
jgi:hypothetical protein